MRVKPCGSKIWDFETSDSFLYHRFVRVLNILQITPLEEYTDSIDCCGCKFCCTKQERLQIEYVFRRMISLDTKYLMDLDSYQNRAVLYREERYAIY